MVQVFFGLHYLAAKVLLEDIPPRTWAAIRVTAAAALLFAAVRLLRRPIPRAPGDLGRLALYALFGVVINQICFVEGLARTTPTHSSLVNTTIPVPTLLFAVLLGRERMSGAKIAALAVSRAGVLLVIHPGRESLAAGTFAGDLLTLVNGLSYSLFLVISKRLLARTDALGATAVLMGFGAVGILLVAGPELVRFRPALVPPSTWALGALIVVFATAGAYLLNYWALARVDSSFVALFIYVQPFIAATLSAVVRAERPGWRELSGGAMIFLGVYLSLPRSRWRTPWAR